MASEKENQVIQNILAMIAKAEGTTKRGGNPYDAIVGFGIFLKPGQPDPVRGTPTANKPVSKMTFKEVKEFGRALVNATKGKNKDDKYKIGNDASGSSAVGKYQMLSNYFNTDGDGVVGNLQKKLRARGVKGFKDTDIFNERAQDLLAIELLKEKDNKLDGQKILTNYINNPNKQTIAKLMEKIASKWQGVPTAKPGRKNFQKREINYAQALDMIRLPESQYEFAGADERGLATTKNEPPFRDMDDTERMLADEENKRSLLVSPPQTSMRNVGSKEEEERENRIARNQMERGLEVALESNKRLKKIDMDSVVERMRSAFKEKEVQKVIKDFQSTKGLLKALGPSDGSTVSQIEKLAKSKDFIKDVDKLPDRSVIKMFYQLGDMIKDFLTPETFKRAGSKVSLNVISKAQASDKFNIDQLKTTNEKFQDLISRMAPATDTSDIGVSGKPDTILSEEAGSPDMIGDTSDVDTPLVSYGGDKIGTAPELQPTDMDNTEETKNTFNPEELALLEGMSETIKPPAGLSPDLSRNREPQERSQMTTPRPTDDDPEFPEGDNFTPNYAIVDGTPMEDANELGYGSTLKRLDSNIDRLRERSETGDMFADEPMPMGGEADPKVDERDDPTDLSFFQRLFSGGFDFDMGRDSEAEENIGADYFYDEPMPMGGEADPRDESDDVIMNFNEGGEVKADFDGKDDEEEPADPPPLAKPKEVADDIPALLSEGEYVLPANVVRYLGVERIIEMHRRVLAEIQQMEDLGMIQNVDENGEPEQDDTEMKFAEGEEPEEGVTKGTIIIASAKPKGMMCPEPLRFNGGGTGTNDNDDPDARDEQEGTGNPDRDRASEKSDTQSNPNEDRARERANEVGFSTNPNEDRAKDPTTGLDPEGFGFGFSKAVKSGLAKAQQGITDITGYNPAPSASRDREKSEAEASQPGDMDFEFKDPEKITDDEIKVDQVIEDLQSKNVYIEGVGYIPLASLMSPRDNIVV
tara:strand:- start:54 stop:2999 length:2946 start_codon:yes stop_codon:yes gene_type:complete